MRIAPTVLIGLAASAGLAGAAFAQQVTVTYTPPTSREFNGGAEGYAAQTTHTNSVYGGQARGAQPVYAVIAHHVVSGDIQPGSRLLTLVDQLNPQFVCDVSQRRADIHIACSDGSVSQVAMGSSGCGHSRVGEPASVCIGFKAKYAAQRLVAPAGESLRVDDGRLVLTPAAG